MTTKQGIVTSAKLKNTVTVTVHSHDVHPVYQKQFRISTKFLADTAGMEVGLGDEVVIQECRPISKRKHFKVTEVVKKAIRTSDMIDDASTSDQ